MQANPMPGLPAEEIDRLNDKYKGMINDAVPLDHELMEDAINDPQIEEVRVFKLRHGEKVRVGDEYFKVYRIGKNVTLKFIK